MRKFLRESYSPLREFRNMPIWIAFMFWHRNDLQHLPNKYPLKWNFFFYCYTNVVKLLIYWKSWRATTNLKSYNIIIKVILCTYPCIIIIRIMYIRPGLTCRQGCRARTHSESHPCFSVHSFRQILSISVIHLRITICIHTVTCFYWFVQPLGLNI